VKAGAIMNNSKNQTDDIKQWVCDNRDNLYRYALSRTRDKDVAQDIVQETLCSALQSADRYKGQGGADVRRWLFGILKHKVVDNFRKAHKEIPFSLDLAADAKTPLNSLDWSWRSLALSPRSNPLKEVVGRSLYKMVNRELSQMPEKLSQVFKFRELNEMDTNTVCQQLSISKNNFWVRLHRARQRLQKWLKQEHWLKEGLLNEN
jgi:RNA polymerase sigma-70 factor (ECF subfamily)